jgi:PAP2 superfamily protein
VRRPLAALLLAAAGCLGTSAALPATSSADPTATPGHASAPAVDPVLEWNRFALDLQSTPGNQPPTVHPTYELAIMHAAINDAIAAIDRDGTAYLTRVHSPRGASVDAAADAAAHGTLVRLYPSLAASIDQELARVRAQLPSDRQTTQGIRVGETVARRILAERADDGSSAAPRPFQPGTEPGAYQLTPPAFAPPVFTHWGFVKPFALRHASQFRPPPPPALTSHAYAAAVDEVKALGAAQGSTRTPDQTQIGVFWNPPIWATWNRIAESAASRTHRRLAAQAQTFAALNLTFADSVIAFYDAKYAYRLWRPVTAIRNAGADGNPGTTADPTWTPLSATAPDPSYPGAHGTISAAGAAVLSAFYGNHFGFTVTSLALPGVERSFASFAEAAEEASVSRIYNGNHTRIDQAAGENLGRDVAGAVLRDHGRRHGGR